MADDTTTDPEDPAKGEPDPTTDPDPKADTGKTGGDDVQARIDAAVTARLAKERKKWDAEQRTAAERAKMDEADRLKAEQADKDKASDERLSAVNGRLVRAEVKSVALAAGVSKEKLARFMKIVDLDGIDVDDDGDVDEDAADKAVKAALAEMPEFATATGATGSSGGEHNGRQGGKVWTRAEVDKLTAAEFEKHEAEIMAQMQASGLK